MKLVNIYQLKGREGNEAKNVPKRDAPNVTNYEYNNKI